MDLNCMVLNYMESTFKVWHTNSFPSSLPRP